MKQKQVRGSTRFGGVAELARKLGCSASHVSQVLAGKRISNRVMEAAKQAGIIPITRYRRRPRKERVA